MTDILADLQTAMHIESAYHSPRTTRAIEAMRAAQEEIERLRGELRSRCIRCDPGEACIGICGAFAALTQNETGEK